MKQQTLWILATRRNAQIDRLDYDNNSHQNPDRELKKQKKPWKEKETSVSDRVKKLSLFESVSLKHAGSHSAHKNRAANQHLNKTMTPIHLLIHSFGGEVFCMQLDT